MTLVILSNCCKTRQTTQQYHHNITFLYRCSNSYWAIDLTLLMCSKILLVGLIICKQRVDITRTICLRDLLSCTLSANNPMSLSISLLQWHYAAKSHATPWRWRSLPSYLSSPSLQNLLLVWPFLLIQCYEVPCLLITFASWTSTSPTNLVMVDANPCGPITCWLTEDSSCHVKSLQQQKLDQRKQGNQDLLV